MGMAVSKGVAVQQYIAEVLDDPTFRNLGIVPGDQMAPLYASKHWTAFALKPPVEADLLINDESCTLKLNWAGRRYAVVFTDGSVKYAYHPWLAHAGWGIFAGTNSRANDWGCLEGPPFTSYRAELRGVVEACSRSSSPTWIICDNQAVCDQAAALMAKNYALRSTNPHQQDLLLTTPLDQPNPDAMWLALDAIISCAPPNFFRISWMPGHLLDTGKEDALEEYLLMGGTMQLAQGNKCADMW